MKNYKNKNPLYNNYLTESVVAEEQAKYGSTKQCLYCYKQMPSESTTDYHAACCKKFFGQAYQPQIDYTFNDLEALALQYVNTHTVVTGVQSKVSLSWHKKQSKNELKKLTIVGLYGDYILKPPSKYYTNLPELEDCTMKMAAVCGLKTVPHTLMKLKDDTLCYLTKRVDRHRQGSYHMEDMCQLTNRLTDDKYKGSHEQIGKVLLKYSSTAMLDVSNFYEYVLFSYFTGNADMHLKNFSLLETATRGAYILCPAYDMLSTALVNPTDQEELALTLNGKKSKLNYTDFLAAFTTNGLTKKLLDTTLQNFYYCQLEMFAVIDQSFLPEDLKLNYYLLLKARLQKLINKV